MNYFDVLSAYFSSTLTDATLALLLASFAVLLSLFVLARNSPRSRLRILFSLFVAVVFAWSFLASSLLLCGALMGLYRGLADLDAVREVFALAVLASVAFALPFALLVTYKVPRAMAAKLSKDLSEPDSSVQDKAARVAGRLEMTVPKVLESGSEVPFAYSVGSGDGVIVVSRGLLEGLDGDEVETVLAHELAHIKNDDAKVNTMIAVYRRVLFFDPFIRLIEGEVHGQKEFSADELSGRETQKPLSLASALLKIASAVPISVSRTEGPAILGRSEVLHAPSVRERVERLMRLEAELERERPPLSQRV